jgi:hypothetical protein
LLKNLPKGGFFALIFEKHPHEAAMSRHGRFRRRKIREIFSVKRNYPYCVALSGNGRGAYHLPTFPLTYVVQLSGKGLPD